MDDPRIYDIRNMSRNDQKQSQKHVHMYDHINTRISLSQNFEAHPNLFVSSHPNLHKTVNQRTVEAPLINVTSKYEVSPPTIPARIPIAVAPMPNCAAISTCVSQ